VPFSKKAVIVCYGLFAGVGVFVSVVLGISLSALCILAFRAQVLNRDNSMSPDWFLILFLLCDLLPATIAAAYVCDAVWTALRLFGEAGTSPIQLDGVEGGAEIPHQ
jgi:hypothetical protein